MSDPSRAKPAQYRELTYGLKNDRSQENKDLWEAVMKQYALGRKDNPSQMKVLQAASSMRHNVVAVSGPPGTSKTRTLRDQAIALSKIKHKTLCAAGANVAVNTDAIAVWSGLTKEERKEIKCLRLESGGAEAAAVFSKANYAAYKNIEGEADKTAEYLEVTPA